MGLLDGGLQATFGNVFSQFFLDGALHTDRKQAIVGGRPSGPVNAAEIAAGNIVVGGTKAQAEKAAAQGAGPATPQVEKTEKAA